MSQGATLATKAAAVSEADVVEMSRHAGRILRAADDGIDVQTGLGLLRLQELQPHNAQRLDPARFCRQTCSKNIDLIASSFVLKTDA